MSLTLYLHPLASYCHKVLVALYENAVPFEPTIVDLGNAAERDAFRAIWPIGKFPVLVDGADGRVVPESTPIIEYVQRRYPGPVRLIPDDADRAERVRAADRFFDLHVHEYMQRIVGDRLRADDAHDPTGVAEARSRLRTALGVVERDAATREWAVGDAFTLADCAAAPALYYADRVMPLAQEFPRTQAYLGRLMQRPSYVRVLAEAAPYFAMFPG